MELARALLLAVLGVAATAIELNLLWRTDVYTNYPRNYGPGIVWKDPSTGLPQLFVQGTYNCGMFMSVISFNPFHGGINWRDRELPTPSYCDFDEQPPIARGLYFYVDNSGFALPILRAYHIHDGSAAWKTTIGTSNSTDRLSNIAVDEATGLIATALLDMLYVVAAASGAIQWKVNTTMPCWTVAIVTIESEGVATLLCSTDSAVQSYNLTSGSLLWNTVVASEATSLLGPMMGKPSYDDVTQTLVVQCDPSNVTFGGFVAALDALTGTVLWNVSSGVAIQPAYVNVLGISSGVVADVEMPMLWNTTDAWLVGRDLQTGAVMWNVTSPAGAFGSFWLDAGVIYALVGLNTVEARSIADGSLQWRWHTDHCARNHTIGVACGLSRPYVWNGTLYVNFGYGEHDTEPFLALSLPQPSR